MAACHGEEFFSGIVRGGVAEGKGYDTGKSGIGMDVHRTNWKALTYED